MRSLLVLLVLTAPAFADPPVQIVGKLVDVHRRPIESATVSIAGTATHTNANGIYRLVVPAAGTYDVELAYADVQQNKTVEVETIATLDAQLDVDSESVIVIHDPRPMVSRPKLADPHVARRTLPYTDGAIEHDYWGRAWVLLDVDADGVVQRVKLVNKPGYDLGKVAVREAFKLKFNPARDAADRPMPSLVMWTYEWPAYWWLVQMEGVTDAISPQVYTAPCKGSGPLKFGSMHMIYRDCSGPDRELVTTAKWVDR